VIFQDILKSGSLIQKHKVGKQK